MASVPRKRTPKTSVRRFHDPVKRFWSHVQKSSDPDGCWLWTAAKIGSGYGLMSIDWSGVLMHRFSYELHFGPIPGALWVLHRCDTPPV